MEESSESSVGRQERKIIQILNAKAHLLGEELFEAVREGTSSDGDVFDAAINSLRDAGKIDLARPTKKFSNFAEYLCAYEISWPCWLVVVVTLVTVSTIAITDNAFPLKLVRLLAGGAFVMFAPGFSLERLLFERRAARDPAERLALSLGLSLSIVPLVGLLLNYTPWGVQLIPMTTILGFFSLFTILAASYLQYLRGRVGLASALS